MIMQCMMLDTLYWGIIRLNYIAQYIKSKPVTRQAKTDCFAHFFLHS